MSGSSVVQSRLPNRTWERDDKVREAGGTNLVAEGESSRQRTLGDVRPTDLQDVPGSRKSAGEAKWIRKGRRGGGAERSFESRETHPVPDPTRVVDAAVDVGADRLARPEESVRDKVAHCT